MKLDDLFIIRNGVPTSNLEVVDRAAPDLVPFLRPASTQQRALAGFVKRSAVGGSNIHPSESLFVSTNGEGSHTYAYVSSFEFAANSDVSVLIPKQNMALQEKIFYARCISMNRWKFSYGRKPKGDRLKTLDLPALIPAWVYKIDIHTEANTICSKLPSKGTKIPTGKSDSVGSHMTTVGALFDVVYGTNMELVNMQCDEKGINFVSRTSKNNGVSAKVKLLDDVAPIQGPVLSVAGGGSVLETFLQAEPFYSGRDLFYLRPRQPMTNEELLFYCACIRANQFRYSYGRQANKTLKDLVVPDRSSIPSWIYGSIIAMAKECRTLIGVG